MKLAVAGDSAGEGLAKILAEHLKGKHEVSESRAPTPVQSPSTRIYRTA